jgi:hypothetical protein
MAHIALPMPRRFPQISVNGPRERLGSSSALAISWIGMALLFATAALSVYLVQISAVANAGYDLQRLEAERKGWLARNEQLELELAKRRSLAWVESQAVQRLGMVRAEKPVYVQVDAEHEQEHATSNGVARPATPGESVESPPAEARAGRPEPGNPAWAIETMQSWLAVLVSR